MSVGFYILTLTVFVITFSWQMCPHASEPSKSSAQVWCPPPTGEAPHLTAGVSKLPAAMDVGGRRHGITDPCHPDVGEGQVDDDDVGGGAQLSELHKHQQNYDVAG